MSRISVLLFLLASCGGDPALKITAASTATTMTPLVLSATVDSADKPVTYTWDFGDGERGGGANIAHVYADAGARTITLTAKLDDKVLTATHVVTVTASAVSQGTAQLRVHITDSNGQAVGGVAIAGAEVKGSFASAADGAASVTVGRGVRTALRFQKAGYATQVRVLEIPASADEVELGVELRVREPAQTLSGAENGGTITGRDRASVTLLPGGLVDEEGTPVKGDVQVSLTPVDIVHTPFAFPGSMEATRTDGSSTLLATYGVSEFTFEQDGKKLNLTPGVAASIDIPIYAGVHLTGASVMEGQTIGLWSLSETTGLWTQEGTGTVTGGVLRASVSHFSWWNGDEPVPQGGGNGKCCIDGDFDGVCDGAILCWIRGRIKCPSETCNTRQLAGFPQSVVTASLPLDGMYLRFPAGVVVSLEAFADNGALTGTTDVTYDAGETRDLQLIVAGEGPTGDDGTDVTVTLPHDANHTIDTATDTDGFLVMLSAGDPLWVIVEPVFGATLSGTVSIDGGATANFGATAGSIAFIAPSDGLYRVLVTGTAPGGYRLRMLGAETPGLPIAFSPAQNAQDVARDTAVTVTFSAPMNAGTINTSSFVVSASGTPVAGTVSGDGTTFSFTPSALLPAGATITVTLGSSIASAAGDTLPAPLSYSFQTSATSGDIVNLGLGSFQFAAAAGEDGRAIAFVKSLDGSWYYRALTPPATWSAAALAEDSAATAYSASIPPVAAINGSGDGFFAWLGTRPVGGADVWVQRFDNYAPVGVSERIAFGADGDTTDSINDSLSGATDDAGNMVLAFTWYRSNTSWARVKVRDSSASAWSDARSGSDELASHMMLNSIRARATNGRRVVSWSVGSGQQFAYNDAALDCDVAAPSCWNDGWSSAYAVPSSGGNAIDVALNDDGNALFASTSGIAGRVMFFDRSTLVLGDTPDSWSDDTGGVSTSYNLDAESNFGYCPISVVMAPTGAQAWVQSCNGNAARTMWVKPVNGAAAPGSKELSTPMYDTTSFELGTHFGLFRDTSGRLHAFTSELVAPTNYTQTVRYRSLQGGGFEAVGTPFAAHKTQAIFPRYVLNVAGNGTPVVLAFDSSSAQALVWVKP